MDITLHPLVGIVRLLARLHPQPWYYERDPDLLGWRPENVPALLRRLRDEGLVTRVDGPGAVLTAEGLRVAGDPGSLDRLARGVSVNGPEPSQTDAAPEPAGPTPWAARAVVLLNVGVFLWGLWLASNVVWYTAGGWLAAVGGAVAVFLLVPGWMPKRPALYGLVRFGCVAVVLGGLYLALQKPTAASYFWGPFARVNERYLDLLHAQGAVRGTDLLDGAWWRLLTSGLVHAGILSVAMNLSALWSSGSLIERAFGWWRFVLIYALSGFSGACASMAHDPASPIAGVGAWDASCGLLGAIAVFALLHRHRLAPGVASKLLTSVMTSALILGIFSFVAMRSGGLSPAGLIGGAVGGALAAFALYLQRYGGGVVMAVIGLVLLGPAAWAPFGYMQSTRESSDAWEKIERKRIDDRTGPRVKNTMREVISTYQEEVNPLIHQHVSRRDADKIKGAAESMKAGVAKLRELAAQLASAPYRHVEIVPIVDAGRGLLEARAAYYAEAVRYLEVGEKWTKDDETAHGAMWTAVLKAIEAWEAALQGRPKRKKAD